MPASAGTESSIHAHEAAQTRDANNDSGRAKMLRDCAKSLKRSQSAFACRRLRLESASDNEPNDIVPNSSPRSSPRSSPTFALSPCVCGLHRAVGFAALAAAVVAQGCVAAPAAPSPEARVIVRFRAGSPDPSDAAFRARLASRAHVSRVDLLRPMSGGAYVMTVACANPDETTIPSASDPCASALDRLAATEWVTSIETDGREKHQ